MSLFISKLLNIAPASIYTTDITQNKLDFVTDGLLEELDYSMEEMVEFSKNKYMEIIHPEDSEKLLDFVVNARSSITEEVKTIDVRFRAKSGQFHWYHVLNTTLETDEENNPTRTGGWTINIDRKKELEAQLNAAIEQIDALMSNQVETYNHLTSKILPLMNELFSQGYSSGYFKEDLKYLELITQKLASK